MSEEPTVLVAVLGAVALVVNDRPALLRKSDPSLAGQAPIWLGSNR